VDEELYPFIAFSKDKSAERFDTELISVKSVVDSPFEAGSDAFMGVYEKGFGFSFQIPLGGDHTLDIAVNLPWKKYLPKITIDNAGFVTVFIGTALFGDKLEEKASWQSRDMQDFEDGQKRAEKAGDFAQHLAQMGAAYDYYKTQGWKFLGESKLEFGWFVLGSGRWQVDESGTDDETGVMEIRLGTGVLLKYSYSWTLVHMVGPIPAYICFSLGVNAGFGISLQMGWSWSAKKGFGAFEFKPLKDITILISFSFTAQAGMGIKGVADLYVRFLAQLNFRITLVLMGAGLHSFTVGGEISLTVGATIVFVEVSKTWGPWGGTWYDSTASNALPPLQQYVAANAAATQELTWTLNDEGDRLELQPGALASNAAFMNAVGSGLIANAVDAGDAVPLQVSVHDIEIGHRLYRDVDGAKLLDIIVSNFADTEDSFKLTCQVYLDGSDEGYVVTLPYYAKAVANRMTHTITLPLATLVPDAGKHKRARVVISAVGRDEIAYANNEFTLVLGGGDALHFEKQPEDVTAGEGEDVSFQVEVGGGKPPYTYQWQVWDPKHEKWVDLPGFTEPTLSRKDIEKKWDGARFRCVVTDAEGTQIVSQEVVLHVRDGVDTGDHSNLPLYLAVALAALMLLWLLRRRMGGRIG